LNELPDNADKHTRREFLRRVGSAAVATAAATAATEYLRRRALRAAPVVAEPAFGNYRTGVADKLALAENLDHAAAVRAAIGALGGMGAFISKGDVVLIKPNAGFDRPPWVGATTSGQVVGAVVTLCRQAGAAEVFVADYPINDPAGCFDRSGIGPAAKAAGAKLLLPRADEFETVRIGGRRLDVWKAYYKPFRHYRVNRVIGIPTAKTHARAVVSGAIKNWYGLLGGPRSMLHQDLEMVLADLCGMLKPTLIVMDGTRLLLRNGPTGGSRGDVKDAHRILAGTDQVAIDTLMAEWLDKDPAKIEWLHLAADAGLGTMDYNTKLVRAG